MGGKPRKDNKKDDDDENNTGSPRGRGTKKTAVVGMVERGGSVKAKSVAKNELNFIDFLKLIRKVISDNYNYRRKESKNEYNIGAKRTTKM